jgi:hypothetical protein
MFGKTEREKIEVCNTVYEKDSVPIQMQILNSYCFIAFKDGDFCCFDTF